MSGKPEDIYNPNDIIDITPGREGKAGVDFESDEPLIKQVLRKGGKGPDRTDRRPSILAKIDNRTIAILIGVAVLILIFILSVISKLFSTLLKLFFK